MITLVFHKSKSIRFKEALKHSMFFEKFKQDENNIILALPLKEIIEKWEWFNLLFWIVLDWKGTTVAYEGLTYYSHTDKTKIFYTLQQIHCNWINYTSDNMIESYKILPSRSKLLDIDPELLTEEEVNHLIEVMNQQKQSYESYEKKMAEIERMIREGE